MMNKIITLWNSAGTMLVIGFILSSVGFMSSVHLVKIFFYLVALACHLRALHIR